VSEEKKKICYNPRCNKKIDYYIAGKSYIDVLVDKEKEHSKESVLRIFERILDEKIEIFKKYWNDDILQFYCCTCYSQMDKDIKDRMDFNTCG
jgi:hypothetical protein